MELVYYHELGALAALPRIIGEAPCNLNLLKTILNKVNVIQVEKVIFILIHLGLPAGIALMALYGPVKNKAMLLTRLLMFTVASGFLFLWGQWPFAGSYYLRYWPILAFIITLIASARKLMQDMPFFPHTRAGFAQWVVTTIFFIGIAWLFFQTIRGLVHRSERTVELTFPLRHGTFYISSGGSNNWVNNHYRGYPNAQQFAIDINRLGPFQAITKGYVSGSNTDHYIFGDTVYCPCSGKVVGLENGIADNAGASMNVNPENGKGNFVTLQCGTAFVSMFHLQMNSISVVIGQDVRQGEILGRVGNSGFSQEPHLHLQAAEYNADSVRVGIPMVFEGRFLVRNDRMEN